MKKNTAIPAIRFKGFTAPWEQRKLGDIVQITMGQSPDGSTYSDKPSNYVLVQGNADLQNGWVYPRIWTTQLTKKAEAGDLIMSVRAPAGAMGKTAYSAVIGRGVAAIKGNEFIYQLLVKMDIDRFWKKLSCGSTFESLNSDSIRKAEIKAPTTAEQSHLGAFFKRLDTLITLHQRKSEKLLTIKKLLLEKMFPQKGSCYPEIRFKGFTAPWEQRKLGELCNITTGKLDANAMEADGQYEFYTSGADVFKINKAAFEGPAITIAGNGNVGYMHLADGKFNAYQRTYVLTNFSADRQFLYAAIGNELPTKIQEEVRGSGIPYIVLNTLTDLEIPFPPKEEQVAIGENFRVLDKLITLHQRKSFLIPSFIVKSGKRLYSKSFLSFSL